MQKLKRFELEEKVAKLLDHHGNFEEAERYGREALAGNAEVLGPHHKRTLRSCGAETARGGCAAWRQSRRV